MKIFSSIFVVCLIGMAGMGLAAQTDTDTDTGTDTATAASFDYGFGLDRFKPVDTDSATAASTNEEVKNEEVDTETETGASHADATTTSTARESESKKATITPFDEDCDGMRTDYLEIINRPTPWPSRGADVVGVTVRWEEDGRLADKYSECCWPEDEKIPKCDVRTKPKDYRIPTVQWLGDVAFSYLRLQPLDLEAFEENYRTRFSRDFRGTMSHNPRHGNTIWGADVDFSASLIYGAQEEMAADRYRLFARSLNLFGTWRRIPLAWKTQKNGSFIYGRHFFGIHLRAGMIPQSIRYNSTAYDMPEYQFYGVSEGYETAETYRHPGPFTPGLLARTGLTGRSRIGGLIESNNTFSLQVEGAHVPALDFNMRLELLGPTLLAPNQSMALEHPATETFQQERQWADAISGLGNSLVVAPKANLGIVTKTDTARAHLGFSGEYTLQPTKTEYSSAFGFLKSDYRLSTAFLQLSMHFVELEARYMRLKTTYRAPNLASERTQSNNMCHGYVAFHVFQVLAKFQHRLVHYLHALSFYGEYLYKSRTPDSIAQIVYPWHVVPFKHVFKRGVSSLIPLYPTPGGRVKRLHGAEISLVTDVSVANISSDSYLTALVGIRVNPY